MNRSQRPAERQKIYRLQQLLGSALSQSDGIGLYISATETAD
jgi:hypothetical protein